MSALIDSEGEIEIVCRHAGSALTPGDSVGLMFRPIDKENPPYGLKITSPSGATIVDTIVRDLPTGLPQSPPPHEFMVSAKGVYHVEIREMKGRSFGKASIRVT